MLRFTLKPRFSQILALLCFVLAFLSFLSPVWPGTNVEEQLGGLLTWAAILCIIHGFRRSEKKERHSAWLSGGLSLAIAILLTNTELLLQSALLVFVGSVLAIDALRYLRKYFKDRKSGNERNWDLYASLGNLLLLAGFFMFRERGINMALAIMIGLRIIGTALDILTARLGRVEEVSEDLIKTWGLESNAEAIEIIKKTEREEAESAPYDKRWIISFLVVLFFIHLGRMGFDRSFLGILSPLVALIGDMVIALIVTYGILAPLRFAFRKSSSFMTTGLLRWVQRIPADSRKKWGPRSWAMAYLRQRLRISMRLRKAGYSFRTAIRTGLRTGLSYAAILTAVMPVLGMSWYFDTENWASGIWDRWAASRADVWRMAITSAMGESYTAGSFRLYPEGINDSSDFSFVVIGDPGEGDASQLVLKDQILKVTGRPEVKFLVISSDVIYPSGALKDYEKKFFLPFKGVQKPIYAIPGNHDWYDALEGFMATFYEPDKARIAMKARIREDLNISSTTSGIIDEMIHRVGKWKDDYQVKTGYQSAPYFYIQAGDFVFISVETGVLRQIDSLQKAWLTSILQASSGKFVMVLLGHPFYAVGEYQGSLNPAFEEIHKLLRDYRVPLVMAGDTHDLEYYLEPPGNGDACAMHHFVNGGGGAYLSIGTAMADEKKMPVKDYAFYPPRNPLVKKIEDNTSWYKYPAWWWTRKFNGWPFSPEWLSAAFDYNVSPFFQSFMEIRVERSRNQVRLIPFSNHGRIKWKDLTSTPGARPANASPEDEAEWRIPFLTGK